MGRKRKHKTACSLVDATPPVAAATESKPRRWTAPEKGLLKLNFTGASKRRRSSVGGVFRDDRGKFVLGYAHRIGIAAECVTKLVALKRGLELAVENGWRDISIESDFWGATTAMAGDCDMERHGMLRDKRCLKQCTEIAAMLPHLGESTVSHVTRKRNKVAKGFAVLGHKAVTLKLWRDIPPEEVLQDLEKDVAELGEEDEQSCVTCVSCKAAAILEHREQDATELGEEDAQSCVVCASCKAPPILQHLEQDATELGEEDAQSCVVCASCKAAPTTQVAEVESKPQNLKSGAPSSSSIWSAPEKGRLKLNFDGSSMGKSKSKQSSIGGVYRDHEGKFILGYAQQIGRATSSVAELVALKCGLELAMKNGWRDIFIEGDFKSAIDAIASGVPFGAKKDQEQYREISTMLPLLGKTTMSHVLRKGNKVANCFADLGHTEATLRLWHHIPPKKVLKHLKKDVSEVHYPIG